MEHDAVQQIQDPAAAVCDATGLREPAPPQLGRRGPIIGFSLILVLAVFLAYIPAMRGGFIWDDDDYVTENPTLRDGEGLRQIWFKPGAVPQYYPLVHTTFWIEYHLWELNPHAYHAVNVALHAANSILLLLLLLRLGVPGAWFAAAVFALHPVHAESVAWITERKNVLSGLFYLASALAYCRFSGLGSGDSANEPVRKFGVSYALSLVLYVCALFSKTIACSLPAALLLAVYWKRGRIRRGDIVPLLPFFAIGLGLSALTIYMEEHRVGAKGAEFTLSFIQRVLIAGRALWFYAGKLVWPHPLAFMYVRWKVSAAVWWQYLFPLAAVIAIACLWALRGRIGRGPIAAVLFFAGTLLPALGFINVFPMKYTFVADHYQYLASIGIIVLAAASLRKTRIPPPAAISGAAAICAVLAALTFRQGFIYKDLKTLWTDTLRKDDRVVMAHVNVASALDNEGKTEEALAHYRRALELDPNDELGQTNLAVVLTREGRLAEAAEFYSGALKRNPENATAQYCLASILAKSGQVEQALPHFREALRLKPGDPYGHYNFGIMLLTMSRFDEAEARLREAVKIRPDWPEGHLALGESLLPQRKTQDAVREFQIVQRLKPNDSASRTRLIELGAMP